MDPLEGNSKLAHHLLVNMHNKSVSPTSRVYVFFFFSFGEKHYLIGWNCGRYPSFFESRLGDGLQMSFIFFETTVSNHKLAANAKSNPIAFVKPGITRIYRLIRSIRNSRNKFVHSIVRKFEPDDRNRSTVSFLV